MKPLDRRLAKWYPVRRFESEVMGVEKVCLALLLNSVSITAAVVQGDRFLSRQEYPAEIGKGTESLLAHLTDIVLENLRQCRSLDLEPAGIGVVLPSPFESGGELSRLVTPGSFAAVYGVSLREELQWRIGGSRELRFPTLGELFCLRECTWGEEAPSLHRAVSLYLDVGMETGFYAEGHLVKDGPLVPENGWLYRKPLENSVGERYAAASGVRQRMHSLPALSGIPDLDDLARMVRQGDDAASLFCQEFGGMLAELIVPWCLRFRADTLLLGGRSSDRFPLISGALRQTLNAREIRFHISPCCGPDLLPAVTLLF